MNYKTCIYISVRRAFNKISKLYDSGLSTLNIKITQYSVLKNIQNLGNPSVIELSQRLALERSTVLFNLYKLKKMGLITYKKSRIIKIKIIFLTDIKIKKLYEAEVLWKKTQKNLNALGLKNENNFIHL